MRIAREGGERPRARGQGRAQQQDPAHGESGRPGRPDDEERAGIQDLGQERLRGSLPGRAGLTRVTSRQSEQQGGRDQAGNGEPGLRLAARPLQARARPAGMPRGS